MKTAMETPLNRKTGVLILLWNPFPVTLFDWNRLSGRSASIDNNIDQVRLYHPIPVICESLLVKNKISIILSQNAKQKQHVKVWFAHWKRDWKPIFQVVDFIKRFVSTPFPVKPIPVNWKRNCE